MPVNEIEQPLHSPYSGVVDEVQAKRALRELGARIAKAREAKGWEQKVLGGKVGVTQTTISRIESGGAAPSEELLIAIAGELDLDLDELRRIFAPFVAERGVPEAYRRFLNFTGELAAENPRYNTADRATGRFPVYGLAACGEMADAVANDELPDGHLRLTDPWLDAAAIVKDKKHSFVVEAEGESMLDTIRPGDELLVDPKAKLENGCVALVQLGGKAQIKRWLKEKGVIILTPDNPDRKSFPVKSFTEGQFANENGTAWRVVLARTTRRL